MTQKGFRKSLLPLMVFWESQVSNRQLIGLFRHITDTEYTNTDGGLTLEYLHLEEEGRALQET